jgi:GT2 family glycosyltransferase
MTEARYEFLTFVDDDNWLEPDWIQTTYDVMREHPEVGALGGIIEPEFETRRPGWFGPVAYLYATGPSGEPSGDVTGMHMLCGAGLNVRHSALIDLRQKGFRPISVGRTGSSLGAGEDSELTYCLRLAGWRLWIDPRLRIRHFLPERRLQWDYARRLAYWSAYATPERDALVYACKPPRHGLLLGARKLRETWLWQVGGALTRLLGAPAGIVKRGLGRAPEGDADVLEVEFLRGRLDGLLAARRWYGRRSSEVRKLMTRLARHHSTDALASLPGTTS